MLSQLHCHITDWNGVLQIIDQIEAYEEDMIQQAHPEDAEIATRISSLRLCELKCLCYMKLSEAKNYRIWAGVAGSLREQVENDSADSIAVISRKATEPYRNVCAAVTQQHQGAPVGPGGEYMAPILETATLSPDDILIVKPGQVAEFRALGHGIFEYERPKARPFSTHKAFSRQFLESARWLAAESFITAISGGRSSQHATAEKFERIELPLDLWFTVDHVGVMQKWWVASKHCHF